MWRETKDMPYHQATTMKTEMEYPNLLLGDGTSMVVPPIPNVLICTPPLQRNRNNCARSTIRFMRRHKFGASTTDVSEQGTALLRFLSLQVIRHTPRK